MQHCMPYVIVLEFLTALSALWRKCSAAGQVLVSMCLQMLACEVGRDCAGW